MRRRCLSAFRAFAWGLQQLGIEVGATEFPKRSGPLDPTMAAFIQYGQKIGWAEHTLELHRRFLEQLQTFQARRRAPWPVPRLTDLDRFLYLAAKRWKRGTIYGAAGTFRAWLRFLFVTGRSSHDLASSFTIPPSIPCPEPRRAQPWDAVRRLRQGIDRSTPVGLRDDAQYHLFCAYGLSSAEVTHLQLKDVDWESGILHIRRQKNGAAFDLPLLPAVARSIAVYLRRARPHSPSRHVFIRHTIPFGPLNHATIGERVRCWAERSHVRLSFVGAHLFRHSFATHQLERGMSLKAIGDILGHRDCRTTGIYTRSALARLRKLALPVPR
jgi:site-specific recombinase XerD